MHLRLPFIHDKHKYSQSKVGFRCKPISVQPRPSAVNYSHCPHLPLPGERRAAAPLLLSAPAAGTRRRQLTIDISCSQGAQQQTRRPSLLLSIDGTDRHRIGRYVLCGQRQKVHLRLFSELYWLKVIVIGQSSRSQEETRQS